jgi:hypothetical protein
MDGRWTQERKGSKDGKFTNEMEGEKGCDNDTAPTNTKRKKMIRGPMTYKRCREKGHRKASSKCPLNGTTKKVNSLYIPQLCFFYG